MLTGAQKLAFSLHSLIFFYCGPVPLYWNKEGTHLIISKSIFKWTLWLVLALMVLLHALEHAVFLVWYGWLAPRRDFTWLNSIMSTVVVIILLAYVIVAFTSVRQRSAVVSSLNSILQLSINLETLLKLRRSKSKRPGHSELQSIFDLTIFAFVLCGGCFPIVITTGGIYTDNDMLRFIFNDVIPVDKMYWNEEILQWTILARVLTFFITWVEVARTGTYFGCCFFTGVDHCCRIVALLSKHFIVDTESFGRAYSCLQIVHAKIRKWFEMLLYIAIFIGFWGTVLVSWFTIRCYGKIEWAIYLGAVFMTVVLIFGNFILFPEIIQAFVEVTRAATNHYRVVRLRHVLSKNKSRELEIYVKRAKAIRPIIFWYGTFFVMDQLYLADYLWMLMNRTVDAILIIEVPNFNLE